MPIVGGQPADYQILVSRADERPSAELYAFNLRDDMPKLLLPLDTGDADLEPVLDIKQLLNQVCQDTAVDIDIDYTMQPQPALSEADMKWIKTLAQT